VVKRFVNDKFREKLPAPVPIELIVVIATTLICHFLQLSSKYGVIVVGKIPTGIPSPRFPPISLFSTFLSQAFSIALVSFALNISTAKFYAKKYNYTLNINQVRCALNYRLFLSEIFEGF
jgi:MFS superfamily sulfate permease-like transporter